MVVLLEYLMPSRQHCIILLYEQLHTHPNLWNRAQQVPIQRVTLIEAGKNIAP